MRNKTGSLLHIFPSPPFVDVLSFFLFHPDEETYLARVVSATGRALIQVQRAIQRLIASGLVTKITRRKKAYYVTSSKHPALRDLKQVVLESMLLSLPLQKVFKPALKKIKYGFIFGSAARGDDVAGSDIDFFFVGDLSFSEMSKLPYDASQKLHRECNGVVFKEKELLEKMQNPSAFISEVVKGQKIWMWGDEKQFAKMAR